MSDVISLDPNKYFVLLDVDNCDHSLRALNLDGGGCLVQSSYKDKDGRLITHQPIYLSNYKAIRIPNSQRQRYLEEGEQWENLFELKKTDDSSDSSYTLENIE